MSVLLLGLSPACASTQIDVGGRAPLEPRPVVLLPLVNASGAPLAGERAEAILTTLLRGRGVDPLHVYEEDPNPDAPPEIDDRRRYERALLVARKAGMGWGVTGTVLEWGYRPGLADEPAVSISLRVVDVTDGRVAWSASAARGGGGTVAGLAQGLLRELANAMPLEAR